MYTHFWVFNKSIWKKFQKFTWIHVLILYFHISLYKFLLVNRVTKFAYTKLSMLFYTETSVGVFAKRTIQKNVQFGPFVGELVMKDNDINSKFPLAVRFYILQAIHFENFY